MDDSSYRGDTDNIPLGKVRLSDLARLAGVSVATVSRSLRNSPLINPSTRRRVIQVANARGYISSRGEAHPARELRTSIMILMHAGGFGAEGTPALPPVLTCLIEAALQRRCELSFSCVQPDELSDLGAIVSRTQCDACMVVADHHMLPAFGTLIHDRQVVVWGEIPEGAAMASLAPDFLAAGRMATDHLLARGHRRVAFVGDTARSDEFQRFSGYVMALSEAGAGFDPALVTEPHAAVRHLARQRPDAIFAASEDAAHRLCLSAELTCPIVAWHSHPLSQGDPRLIGAVHYNPAATARLLLDRLIYGSIPGAERVPVFLRLRDEYGGSV